MYLIAKVQKSFGNESAKNRKHKKKSKNIWNLLKIFLSLQRQNVSFDYPVNM